MEKKNVFVKLLVFVGVVSFFFSHFTSKTIASCCVGTEYQKFEICQGATNIPPCIDTVVESCRVRRIGGDRATCKEACFCTPNCGPLSQSQCPSTSGCSWDPNATCATPTPTPTPTPVPNNPPTDVFTGPYTPVLANGSTVYSVSVEGRDADGGADIVNLYALTNLQDSTGSFTGGNAGQYRGYLGWSANGNFPSWSTYKDLHSCNGGGYAAIMTSSPYGSYGSDYIDLAPAPSGAYCSTTKDFNGVKRRQVTFYVKYNTNFTAPITGNIVSGWVMDSKDQTISNPWYGWKPDRSFDLVQSITFSGYQKLQGGGNVAGDSCSSVSLVEYDTWWDVKQSLTASVDSSSGYWEKSIMPGRTDNHFYIYPNPSCNYRFGSANMNYSCSPNYVGINFLGWWSFPSNATSCNDLNYYVNACPAEVTCSQACGYAGGWVANGTCGSKYCPSKPACCDSNQCGAPSGTACSGYPTIDGNGNACGQQTCTNQCGTGTLNCGTAKTCCTPSAQWGGWVDSSSPPTCVPAACANQRSNTCNATCGGLCDGWAPNGYKIYDNNGALCNVTNNWNYSWGQTWSYSGVCGTNVSCRQTELRTCSTTCGGICTKNDGTTVGNNGTETRSTIACGASAQWGGWVDSGICVSSACHNQRSNTCNATCGGLCDGWAPNGYKIYDNNGALCNVTASWGAPWDTGTCSQANCRTSRNVTCGATCGGICTSGGVNYTNGQSRFHDYGGSACGTTAPAVSSLSAGGVAGSTSAPGPTISSLSVTFNWTTDWGLCSGNHTTWFSLYDRTTGSYINNLTDLGGNGNIYTTSRTLIAGHAYQWFIRVNNGLLQYETSWYYFNILPPPSCTSVTLAPASANMAPGTTQQMSVQVIGGANTTSGTVSFTSSNNSIVAAPATCTLNAGLGCAPAVTLNSGIVGNATITGNANLTGPTGTVNNACFGTTTINVFNLAWLQSRGGDVHGRGAVGTIFPTALLTYFSLDNAGVISSGNSSFSPAIPTAKISTRQWRVLDGTDAFSSFGATNSRYNYSYFYEKLGSPASPAFTGTKPVASATYYAGGPVTTSGAWSLAGGEKMIIFVNGDLTVNTNITVANGGFLAFIVNGNINFSNSLGTSPGDAATSTVEGVFIANGDISTGTRGAPNQDLRFNGKGIFVADADFSGHSFNFQRDFRNSNNNDYPSEYFEFRPDLLLNFPKTAAVKKINLWREVAP